MTIYECIQTIKGKQVITYKPTEAIAITWLELNGGGIYRNALHKFQFTVQPKK